MEAIYDMSFGKVSVNLDALHRVAAVAVQNARIELERNLKETYTRPKDNTPESVYHANSHAQFYAKQCAESARNLSEAFQIYHALTEAVNGRELTVNK